MDRRNRILRTGILCQHALRNLAYVEVLSEHQTEWEHQDFWICIHNNFLDVGILEWCKLFTESTGKHHWSRSVSDRRAFEAALQTSTSMSVAEFTDYGNQLRWYRNRFLAHLDDDNVYRLPRMITAIASAKALLHWLIDKEDDCSAFPADHISAEEFHARVLTQARIAISSEA